MSIAKRVVEMSGDLTRTGTGIHGKVAGTIKDKVEQGLGVGGGSASWARRGPSVVVWPLLPITILILI